MKAVVALGGNALIKPGQEGTIYEQFANMRKVAKSLVKMIQNGWEIVITHGNGPQVGSILLQQEVAKDAIPPMPLGICVAQSEGQIGYMIQQCLSNALKEVGIDKQVVTIITQVLVDKNDSAFDNPTKPVGPLHHADDAIRLLKKGHPMAKQKDGWRILVPSPDPISIVESEIVERLLDEGVIVIAAGGGGIPVMEKNGLDGLEAVIDKDLVSERLATEIGADLLLILTDVDYAYINYRKPKQKKLKKISRKELREYYEEGQFLPGSMGPKVLAVLRFLENGGKKAVITSLNRAWEGVNGKIGTQVVI